MKKRNIEIDILRCIGLLVVILVHVPINEKVKEFFSFGVILLIYTSGMSFFEKIENTRNFSYKKYLFSRIKRLCIPTWITIIIIFLLAKILCLISNKEYIYTMKKFLESIFFIGGLNGGIGNVWIVRIYLFMAILSYIFIKINKYIVDYRKVLVYCILILIINEIIVIYFYDEGTLLGQIIENIISSILCYSLVYLFGMRNLNVKDNKRYLFIFIIVLFLILVILVINNKSLFPHTYKYPPRIYYWIYGVIVTLILNILANKIK